MALVPLCARCPARSTAQLMFSIALSALSLFPLLFLLRPSGLLMLHPLIGYYLWEISMLCIAAWFINANFIASSKQSNTEAQSALTLET